MDNGIRVYEAEAEMEIGDTRAYRAHVTLLIPDNPGVIPDYRREWRVFAAVATDEDCQALADDLARAALMSAASLGLTAADVVIAPYGTNAGSDPGEALLAYDLSRAARDMLAFILEQKRLFGGD